MASPDSDDDEEDTATLAEIRHLPPRNGSSKTKKARAKSQGKANSRVSEFTQFEKEVARVSDSPDGGNSAAALATMDSSDSDEDDDNTATLAEILCVPRPCGSSKTKAKAKSKAQGNSCSRVSENPQFEEDVARASDSPLGTGAIVWAKPFTYSWWPGRIGTVRGSQASVSFFGCNTTKEWFNLSEICEFEQNFARISKTCRLKLSEEIDMALEELNRREANGLMCTCCRKCPLIWDDQVKRRLDPLEMVLFARKMAVSTWIRDGEAAFAARVVAQVNAYRSFGRIGQISEIDDEGFDPAEIGSADLSPAEDWEDSLSNDVSEGSWQKIYDSLSENEILFGESGGSDDDVLVGPWEENERNESQEGTEEGRHICVINRADFSIIDLDEEYYSMLDSHFEDASNWGGSTIADGCRSPSLKMNDLYTGHSSQESELEVPCGKVFPYVGDNLNVLNESSFYMNKEFIDTSSCCDADHICMLEERVAQKINLLAHSRKDIALSRISEITSETVAELCKWEKCSPDETSKMHEHGNKGGDVEIISNLSSPIRQGGQQEISDYLSESEIVFGEIGGPDTDVLVGPWEEEEQNELREQMEEGRDTCVINRADFNIIDLDEEYYLMLHSQLQDVSDWSGSEVADNCRRQNLDLNDMHTRSSSLESEVEVAPKKTFPHAKDVNQNVLNEIGFDMNKEVVDASSCCDADNMLEKKTPLETNLVAQSGKDVAFSRVSEMALEIDKEEQEDIITSIQHEISDPTLWPVSSAEKSWLKTSPYEVRKFRESKTRCADEMPKVHVNCQSSTEACVVNDEHANKCGSTDTISSLSSPTRTSQEIGFKKKRWDQLIAPNKLRKFRNCFSSECKICCADEMSNIHDNCQSSAEASIVVNDEHANNCGSMDTISSLASPIRKSQEIGFKKRRWDQLIAPRKARKFRECKTWCADETSKIHVNCKSRSEACTVGNNEHANKCGGVDTNSNLSSPKSHDIGFKKRRWDQVIAPTKVRKFCECETWCADEMPKIHVNCRSSAEANIVVNDKRANECGSINTISSLSSPIRKGQEIAQSGKDANKIKLCKTLHLKKSADASHMMKDICSTSGKYPSNKEVIAAKTVDESFVALANTISDVMKHGSSNSNHRWSCKSKRKGESLFRSTLCGKKGLLFGKKGLYQPVVSDHSEWRKFYYCPLKRDGLASPSKVQRPLVNDTLSSSSKSLHMKFPRDFPLPSKEELEKKFGVFGPLLHSRTKIFFYTGAAQVVFLHEADAHVAYKYVKRNNLFGPADIRFWFDKYENIRKGSGSTSVVGQQHLNLKSCLKIPVAFPGREEKKKYHVSYSQTISLYIWECLSCTCIASAVFCFQSMC